MVQEGEFPEALGQDVERARCSPEDVGVRPEGDRGPASVRLPSGGGRGERDAASVLLEPSNSLAPHLGRQAARQSVGDAGPDTEEAHGHGVAPAWQCPGMHTGQEILEAGTTVVPLDGDAGPVVGDTHAAVGRESDVDGARPAGKDFVHRPPGEIEHHLMHTAFSGGADVHAGPFPHGLAPFQNLDVAGVVRVRGVAHEVPLQKASSRTISLGDRGEMPGQGPSGEAVEVQLGGCRESRGPGVASPPRRKSPGQCRLRMPLIPAKLRPLISRASQAYGNAAPDCVLAVFAQSNSLCRRLVAAVGDRHRQLGPYRRVLGSGTDHTHRLPRFHTPHLDRRSRRQPPLLGSAVLPRSATKPRAVVRRRHTRSSTARR
ncbi:hypothetical protein STANM309S_04135 [Streptomyces tanashiensis]